MFKKKTPTKRGSAFAPCRSKRCRNRDAQKNVRRSREHRASPYHKPLQDGPASVVVPIDKLSLLVSIGFSCAVFRERLTGKAAIGLAGVTAGTLLMLL